MTVKSKVRYGVFVTLLGSVLAVGPLGGAAQADTTLSLDNPTALVSTLAPEYVTDDLSDASVTTPPPAPPKGGPSPVAPVGKGDVDPSLPAYAARLTTPSLEEEDTSVDSMKIELPADMKFSNVTGDYRMYGTKTRASYVNATPDGGQVIFAATTAKDINRLSVKFESPIVDANLVDDGVNLIEFANGQTIALYPAWARDANGQPLTTSYTIGTDTVTQTVATTTATKFPVVADPAWSYSKRYKLGKTTWSKAKNRLHDCFNCNFPVQGAPKAFPSPGTNLPLYVGIKYKGVNLSLNFSCTFDKEFTNDHDQSGAYFGYTFDANKKHIDGKGSHIIFTFITGRNGKNTLNVYGYIKKSHPAHLPRLVYVGAASAEWYRFALKMKS